jgi:hypothetical protein
VTALGLTTTTVAARDEGELPNGNVSTSPVNPFFRKEVPTGDWVHHRFGWVESCKDPATNARRAADYLDVTDITVHINGERIENPEQYYADSAEPFPPGEDADTTDARWVPFSYYTPPKGVGEYSFARRVEYTDEFFQVDAGPVGDICSENDTIEKGTVFNDQAPYAVVSRKGGPK